MLVIDLNLFRFSYMHFDWLKNIYCKIRESN